MPSLAVDASTATDKRREAPCAKLLLLLLCVQLLISSEAPRAKLCCAMSTAIDKQRGTACQALLLL